MGCLVTKSTLLRYQEDLSYTQSNLEKLEERLRQRQQENEIDDIDYEDRLDYLSYQEQLRTRQVLSVLSKYLGIKNVQIIENPSFQIDPIEYLHKRYKQTEFSQKITDSIVGTAEKLKISHGHKIVAIDERIKNLADFVKTKLENGHAVYEEITQRFQKLHKYDSLDELIDCLIKMNELQKDLEILQRRCDYKKFILSQEAKVKAKEDARTRILELQKDIENLNSNWADMKDKERRDAEEYQNLQDTIEMLNTEISSYTKEKLNLENYLQNFDQNLQSLSQTTSLYNSKCSEFQDLELAIEAEVNESLIIENPNDIEELKTQNQKLNDDIFELKSQLTYLESLQNARCEELKNSINEEILRKESMVKDLEIEVLEKEEEFRKSDKSFKEKIMGQMALRIIASLKDTPKSVLNKWNLSGGTTEKKIKVEDEVKVANPFMSAYGKFPDAEPWDSVKLNGFFDDLIAEKMKQDTIRLKDDGIPLQLHTFLLAYIKNLYDLTGDTEKQIASLMVTIVPESTPDPLASIIRRMLGLSRDCFPYHFVYFLTSSINDFNTFKDKSQDTIHFDKAIELIDSYVSGNKILGAKILFAMRPQSISIEDYVLFHLKKELSKLSYEFTQLCDSSQHFIDVATNELNVYVPVDVLENFKNMCEKEFDINFDMKIEMSINTLNTSKFMIKKHEFLTGMIEIFTEQRLAEAKTLEVRLKATSEITEEIFQMLINEIDPSVNSEEISKLFAESIMDTTEISYIKSINFIQIVMKYGIGGYGVGTFKTNILGDILKKMLKRLTSRDKIMSPIEEFKEIKRNYVPYKVTLKGVGSAPEHHRVSTPTSGLLAPKKIMKLSDMKKNLSPTHGSEKNLRRSAKILSPIRSQFSFK